MSLTEGTAPQPGSVAGFLNELPTPAVLLDRATLEANIAAMAARVERAGAELWPHIKTHKSPQIAELQREAGASGATAATLAEAEMLADHGFSQILLAYPPVGEWRLERVAALAGRCSLTVALDRVQIGVELDCACAAADADVSYLWEIDSGLHRCGTEPGGETAELIAELRGRTKRATFAGLMSFPGHAYGARTDQELRDIAQQEFEAIAVTAAALARRGIDCPVLSIGSTPTAHQLDSRAEGMQVRPGNYVFYDATQVALGLVEAEQCALTVLATVISRPAPDRLVLDSGSKALSTDRMTERARGYGTIIGHPGLVIERLFEEHAVVHGDAGTLSVGSRVRIIPNHSCAVANLHPHMHIIEAEEIVDRWPVGVHGWEQAESRTED